MLQNNMKPGLETKGDEEGLVNEAIMNGSFQLT
jgi:hypothetical protein